jgi:hypothetical protein
MGGKTRQVSENIERIAAPAAIELGAASSLWWDGCDREFCPEYRPPNIGRPEVKSEIPVTVNL